MKKLLFLLVLAVMCSSVVIADDLKDVLNGVKADQKESYTRYLAEQGDADAQYYLGVMYSAGEGVIKDYKEAAKWFRLAAEQGNANSQFSLGFMYSNGQGVIRDLVLAHIWYNLAASNGSERGKKNRDFIALGMDSAQISKAQDMARDCLIKKYKNCDFSSAVYSEEPKVDAINEEKIALACSGKHPQRNIQNTVLFLIDRKKDVLQESRYCGSFEDVDIVLGSIKDNQLVWYSASPFVRNAYGEKILNLKKLKFEYRRTWRRSHEKGGAVRGERSWSAQCNIIDWEDAIELRKKLRC